MDKDTKMNIKKRLTRVERHLTKVELRVDALEQRKRLTLSRSEVKRAQFRALNEAADCSILAQLRSQGFHAVNVTWDPPCTLTIDWTGTPSVVYTTDGTPIHWVD
jgi:hypothetical protein